MKDVRLIKLEAGAEKKLAGDPRYAAAFATEEWEQLAEAVYDVIGHTVAILPEHDAPLAWGDYLVADVDTREIVGSCAYKGEPSADGVVEIAYFTYPDHQGHGYATAMAAKLIAAASASPDIRVIIAHTLPQASASSRILEKVGMRFAGEINDPEDGAVWRWEMACGG